MAAEAFASVGKCLEQAGRHWGPLACDCVRLMNFSSCSFCSILVSKQFIHLQCALVDEAFVSMAASGPWGRIIASDTTQQLLRSLATKKGILICGCDFWHVINRSILVMKHRQAGYNIGLLQFGALFAWLDQGECGPQPQWTKNFRNSFHTLLRNKSMRAMHPRRNSVCITL